ncbi:MAG TPA: type II toxin-antitoxin system VapC family toxin [Marmoricola sp.]|nr:type II toxin-antitoxin system VapC family toxin [Marmoricola sp.]
MNLVDANVLVYAYNRDAERHEEARGWLDQALSGGSRVGLAWAPLLAFVRLVTRRGLFPAPVSPDVAMAQVQEWLAQPGAELVQPTPRHPFVLAELLQSAGLGGNLVNDAHLAALAIEHRAAIVSYDDDFDRFPVRWSRPADR